MEGFRGSGERWAGWLVAGLLVTAIGGLIAYSTADGQAMVPGDSPSYLSSAENLAFGRGYLTDFGDRGKPIDFESTASPVVDFPPGYPFLLSLGVEAGLEVEQSARLVAVGTVVAIWALFFVFARSRLGSLLGGIIVGTLAAMLTVPVAVVVLAEPVFGLLTAVALIGAGTFVRSGRPAVLALAATAAIAATTVRTIGVAGVVVVAIAAWVGLDTLRRRLLWSGSILLAGALTYQFLIGAGSRVLAWHPPDATAIRVTADAVTKLLLPPLGTPIARVAALIAIVALLTVWLLRAEPEGQPSSRSVGWVGLLAAAGQIGLLLITRTFLDAQTDLSTRLLYPVALSLVVSGVEFAAQPRAGERGKTISLALSGLAVMALVAATWSGVDRGWTARLGLRGLASPGFVESPAMDFAAAGIPGSRLFSNVPDGLWIAGIDGARPIPASYDPLSLRPNEGLRGEMSQLREEVERDAALFLYRYEGRQYTVEEADLLEIAPCVAFDDGRFVILVAEEGPLCDP